MARCKGRFARRGLMLLLVCIPAVAGLLRADLAASGDRGAQLRVESFETAWRILNETYFDPSFHGLDWTAVRREFQPKAEAAANSEELRTVIEEMLQRLGDSHMALIPGSLADWLEQPVPARAPTGGSSPGAPQSKGLPEQPSQEPAARVTGRVSPVKRRGSGDVGMEVRMLEEQAVVTRVEISGPAAKAGVKTGWVLESVDGEPVRTLLEPAVREGHSRGQFVAWGLMSSILSGAPGSVAEVDFLNGAGKRTEVELERESERGQPTTLGDLPTFYARLESELLPGSGTNAIGLLRFNVWMPPVMPLLDAQIDEFRRAQGIIIDLRGNIGGMGAMVMGVAGHFLNERISLGTLKMRGSDLQFFANPRRVSPSGARVEPYAGPVAILVDALSLSASEIFAGGMKAIGRARVFGETSGGQALPAIWDRLPNGDVLYHAFGDFITPGGVRLEGRGVVPDELVATTREDLLAGRDAPLQAAVAWIQAQACPAARLERE